MKISRWTLLWLFIVGILITIEVGIVMRVINPFDVVSFFFIVVFALVVIAVLAIIGAVFVGIYISHRILAARDFTPFEQEMLKMAESVKRVSEQVGEITKVLGTNPGPKR